MHNNIRLVGRAVVVLLATAGLAAAATDLRLVDAAKTQDTEAVRRLIKQGDSLPGRPVLAPHGLEPARTLE